MAPVVHYIEPRRKSLRRGLPFCASRGCKLGQGRPIAQWTCSGTLICRFIADNEPSNTAAMAGQSMILRGVGVEICYVIAIKHMFCLELRGTPLALQFICGGSQ